LIPSTKKDITINNDNQKQKYDISHSTTRTLVVLLSQEGDSKIYLHA